jgi:hypothetical protein
MITEILFCDPILHKKISQNNICFHQDNEELIDSFSLGVDDKTKVITRRNISMFKSGSSLLCTTCGAKETELACIWYYM